MSERNLVVLVDQHDNFLGVEDKILAHKKGLLHRAFSVMLYRVNNFNKNQIELLLQQRATSKYHCPNLWTNTCCSHPQQNEDLAASALLRLEDELIDIDINSIALENIGSFIYRADFSNGLCEYEYDYVLLGKYNKTPSYVNSNEVQDMRWCSITDIEILYHKNPHSFTPWFYQVFSMVKKKLI